MSTQGTNSSLFLSRHDGAVVTSSGQAFQAFRPYDGPEYVLEDGGTTSTPARVTFYVKASQIVAFGLYRCFVAHVSWLGIHESATKRYSLATDGELQSVACANFAEFFCAFVSDWRVCSCSTYVHH